MTTERIKEIQASTGYPECVSIQQALLQVWNEVAQESNQVQAEVKPACENCKYKSIVEDITSMNNGEFFCKQHNECIWNMFHASKYKISDVGCRQFELVESLPESPELYDKGKERD